MNLDQLKAEWTARDARLEATLHLNGTLLRAMLLDRGREGVRSKAPFGPAALAFWVAALVLLGVFLFQHVHEMKFFVPGLILDAWILAMGIAGIVQRQAILALEYGAPAVAVQRRLEEIRIARTRTFAWAFLTGQIVWFVPFLIVLFKGAFGIDLYALSDFMPRFMVYSVLGGLAFVPLAIWLARRWGTRLRGSGAFQRLIDAVAGLDIVAARTFFDQLSRFERE